MSDTTKKYSVLYWIFFTTSLLLNFCPLAVYTLKAIFECDLIHEKVTLIMTVFIVLILTCVSIVNKIAIRSRLWIVLIGIYLCLDYIFTPLVIIAVCQTVDELIVTPLKGNFKNKLIINKQIDGRM